MADIIKADTGEIIALPGRPEAQLAGVEREKAHDAAVIQAQAVMAMQRPRSEADSFARIKRACERPTFASGAQYRFPRGGSQVSGPSVKLARELARCWGNIWSGSRVVDRTHTKGQPDVITMQGVCMDLETNTRKTMEVTFICAIQRKNKQTGVTEWTKPDPRDELELINRNGAKVERNTILQIIPSDIIEDAIATCEVTSRKAVRGEVKQDRNSTIRNLVAAFSGVGVDGGMIERLLEHPIAQITEDEIVDLRGIFSSVSDGNTKVSEHFTYDSGPARITSLDQAKARLATPPKKEDTQPESTADDGTPPPKRKRKVTKKDQPPRHPMLAGIEENPD